MLYVCIWCKHLFTMFMYVYGVNICSLCSKHLYVYVYGVNICSLCYMSVVRVQWLGFRG